MGIAVGLLVNLAVWPPLRDRGGARRNDALDDRLGALLGDIAASCGRTTTAPSPGSRGSAPGGSRSTAVRRADPGLAGQVRDDLGAVANRLPDDDGGHPIRPAQGAVVLTLLTIVDAMAPVSAIQPIRVHARRPAGRHR